MSMKNPLTLAGIEPATFRFVAQHLNHCATAALGITLILFYILPVYLSDTSLFIADKNSDQYSYF